MTEKDLVQEALIGVMPSYALYQLKHCISLDMSRSHVLVVVIPVLQMVPTHHFYFAQIVFILPLKKVMSVSKSALQQTFSEASAREI